MTGHDMTWQARGNCAGVSPDLFFIEKEDGQAQRKIVEAHAVCSGCAVRAECLTYAVEAGEMFGIWGGAVQGNDSKKPGTLRNMRVQRDAGTFDVDVAIRQADALADKRRRRHEAWGTPTTRPSCGTPSGYRQHKRFGEAACEACLEANRGRARVLYHARKEQSA